MMMLMIVICLGLQGSFSATLNGTTAKPLHGRTLQRSDYKAVFTQYPITAQFRSPPRNPVDSYEQFKSKQFMPEGFPVDLQTNVLRLAPENYKYANQYAREKPGLMLTTWRAASGNPKGKDASKNGDPLGQSVIEFPGHFVLSWHAGSQLQDNIFPTSTIFSVANGTNILQALDKQKKGPALLVEINDKGEIIWEEFEYVLIESVNGNEIKVERSFNGSPNARSFPKTTYLAPMPWDFRVNTRYTDWFFNYAEGCPRDSQGRTAMDVVLGEMIQPLEPGNSLDNLGGLDLASGPLVLNPTNADYDLDGIVDSPTDYRSGVRTFYERVWKTLGDSRVLITELDFEMLGFINGVNREGLARPNDAWREVSRTVNNILAWQKMSNLPMVSLAFVQYQDSNLNRVDLHRLLNGYSTCLGLAADVDEGEGLELLERMELFKGAEKEQHWLGKSVGPLVRPSLLTPNLLLSHSGTSSNDWNGMMPSLSSLRADLIVDSDELVIRPNGQGSGFVTFYLEFELTKKSDVTIFMEAISDDDNVVREIKLPRISVPVETGGVRATLSNIDYIPIGYLMRGVEPSSSIRFDLRFGDGGDIRIKSLGVHAATDSLACQFENGVVLVNPSLEDIQLNLGELFPGRTGYQRLMASNVDKKLIPDKFLPQYDLAMDLNNGQPIDNPNSVTVFERNALFLIADPFTPTTSPTDYPTGSITSSPTFVPTQTSKPSTLLTASPTSCEDTNGKFELNSGSLVGCWYAQRYPSKTEKRCSTMTPSGYFVSYYCPKTCGTCTSLVTSKQPTTKPTNPLPPSPTATTCNDSDEEFELDEGRFVKCKWAGAIPEKTSRRCSVTTIQGLTVNRLCPKTCGTCDGGGPINCSDSGKRFTLQSGSSVRCVWATANPSKIDRRCSTITEEGAVVRDICPLSCGNC